MGLFDFVDPDDRQMMGLSLLSNMFSNMGNPNGQQQNMFSLLSDYKKTKRQDSLLSMQMDEQRRKLEDQQFMRDTAQQYMRSPAQQALAGGQGPTPAAAAQMQNMKPQFDQDGFLGAVMARDPILAMGLKKTLAGEQPKSHLVEVEDPNRPGRMVKRWVKEGEANGVDVGYTPQKLPDGMTLGPDGRPMIDPLYLRMKQQIAAAGRAPAQQAPYFQAVSTPNGVMSFNARTGQMLPVGNQPIMKAADSPELQGQIAQAREAGKTFGEAGAKGQLEAPGAIANGENALRLSNELLKHPGFEQAVGKSSMLGIQNIPGTQSRDFMNRLEQVKGGAFLQAFESLKGGGAITQTEGDKATAAIARMNNSTSEEEFKSAVADFQQVINTGMQRAKQRAGMQQGMPQSTMSGGGVKFLGFE